MKFMEVVGFDWALKSHLPGDKWSKSIDALPRCGLNPQNGLKFFFKISVDPSLIIINPIGFQSLSSFLAERCLFRLERFFREREMAHREFSVILEHQY